MTIETLPDNPADMEWRYLLRVTPADEAVFERAIVSQIAKLVAQRIAETFLETRGSEVLARLSPEAIATMAIAEAGAAVNDTLKRKLPDKIIEVERRVEAEPIVLQRGIFGGLRRL